MAMATAKRVMRPPRWLLAFRLRPACFVSASLARVGEIAERLQQPGLELGGKRGRLDRPGQPNRRLDLLEVVRAAVALGEVGIEGGAQVPVHRALDVLGDELDDLLAA